MFSINKVKSNLMSALVVATVVVLTSFAAFAAGKPPKVVTDAFSKAFPAAKMVKWGKEDGKFEAHFGINKSSMSATYNADGSLVETEESVATSTLPKPVAMAIDKVKGKGKVAEYAKITRADGSVVYEAEIGGKDFLFNADGSMTK